MAEEEIAEEVVEEVVETTEEVKENTEEVEAVDPEQDRASAHGWLPRDKWRGDPDDWASAKKFNERGEMIGEIRKLKTRVDTAEQGFTARLDHHKKLQEAQMKVTISELESRRDEAIDLADRDNANRIQGQIDDVKATVIPETPAPQNEQSIMDDWNASNPWIFEESPKAAYATARFNAHSKNKTANDAILAMEADVLGAFPDINPRRQQASTVEGGRSKPGAKASPKLNWSQLTAEEQKWFDVMPSAWKTKDDYLQAVQDGRNAK